MSIKFMKASLVGLSLFVSLSACATDTLYPHAPIKEITPGVVCTKPDNYRYPEHIAYCERNVDVDMKLAVMSLYSKQISGFVITGSNRSQYKIDHYIPLCMGGANDVANLWPQHMNIFKVTDIVELDLCKEMATGEITQAVAIEQMKFAKAHVSDLAKQGPTDAEVMKWIRDNYNK